MTRREVFLWEKRKRQNGRGRFIYSSGFPTLVELRLQVYLDFAYVEERVRLEHDPNDAAERQEHSQRAAPGVCDEIAFPPAGDLSP